MIRRLRPTPRRPLLWLLCGLAALQTLVPCRGDEAQVAAARELLREAAGLLVGGNPGIPDSGDDGELAAVAVLQTRIGDLDGAFETVARIGLYQHRAAALHEVAATLARQGDDERAATAIAAIGPATFSYWQVPLAWREIAAIQRQRGDRVSARASLQKAVQGMLSIIQPVASDVQHQVRVLCELARRQAEWDTPQTARSTVRQTLEVASSEEDPLQRWLCLELVAGTLAALGERDEACAAARRIETPEWRQSALAEVAAGLAEAGKLDDAAQIATGLESHAARGRAWLEIARAQQRRGEAAAAAASRVRAREAAAASEDPTQGVRWLRSIATAAAEAGDRELARETFREAARYTVNRPPRSGEFQSRLFVYQAEAQAELVREALQDYEQLVAETQRLTNSIGRLSRLKTIAESLMQIGKDDEALKILEEIPKSADWDVVLIQAPIDAIYARRAAALAGQGEIDAALETVQRIKRDYEAAAPLTEIAMAQFRAGRIEEAFRTARKVRDDYQTGEALRRLAGMQARSGQVAEARRWAVRETPARVKAACLRAIAEALVDGD